MLTKLALPGAAATGAGWVPVEPADAHPGRFGCTRGRRLGFSAEPAAAGAAADLLALRPRFSAAGVCDRVFAGALGEPAAATRPARAVAARVLEAASCSGVHRELAEYMAAVVCADLVIPRHPAQPRGQLRLLRLLYLRQRRWGPRL